MFGFALMRDFLVYWCSLSGYSSMVFEGGYFSRILLVKKYIYCTIV